MNRPLVASDVPAIAKALALTAVCTAAMGCQAETPAVKARGLSILLVEQKLGFALEHADYVYVISTGRIVYEGNPVEFRQNEEVQAKYLGV